MAAAKKSAKKATKKAAKKATKKATKKGAARKATKKGARKGAKKATRKASAGASQVVVVSKVRERLRGENARMSSEFVGALNDEVDAIVDRAVTRAKDNGRSTVRPQDL